jgi:hypothetical protein
VARKSRPITEAASSAAYDPSLDRPENRACCSDAAVEARTAKQFEVLAELTWVGMKLVSAVEHESSRTKPCLRPADTIRRKRFLEAAQFSSMTPLYPL